MVRIEKVAKSMLDVLVENKKLSYSNIVSSHYLDIENKKYAYSLTLYDYNGNRHRTVGVLIVREHENFFMGKYTSGICTYHNGDSLLYSKEGEKLLVVLRGKGEITTDSLFALSISDSKFLLKEYVEGNSLYTVYEVVDNQLKKLISFDEMEYNIGFATQGMLTIYQKGNKMRYSFKDKIADPYCFFDEYHDTFAGIDYKALGDCVGIGTINVGKEEHSIIGVVNENGTLVSRLLDWSTSKEYGSPYMDPTKFEETIGDIRRDIKRDMIIADRKIARRRNARAKINMKIMKNKNKKSN